MNDNQQIPAPRERYERPLQYNLRNVAVAVALLAAGLTAWRWVGWVVVFPVFVCYGVLLGGWWHYPGERRSTAVRNGAIGGALGMLIGAIGYDFGWFTDPRVGLVLLVFPALLGLALGAILSLCLATLLYDVEESDESD